MDNTNVIIKPLVTEKSTHQQTTRNVYTFMVHQNANKPQIIPSKEPTAPVCQKTPDDLCANGNDVHRGIADCAKRG